MWCVARPGKQSIFKPKPGMCQECTTSKEFVITVILICAGNTKTLLDLSNLFQEATLVVSNLAFAFFTNLYCLVGLPKFSSIIALFFKNGLPE